MIRGAQALLVVIARSWRIAPWQSLAALTEGLGSILLALRPLFVGVLVDGVVRTDEQRAAIGVMGLVAGMVLSMVFSTIGTQSRIQVNERMQFAFGSDIAKTCATIETIDHLEAPKYLDRFQILRDNPGAVGTILNRMLVVVNNLSFAAASIVTAAIADWRLLLLIALALPRIVAVRWQVNWETTAERLGAEPSRLSEHLVRLMLEPPAINEIRVFRLQQAIRARVRAATLAWRQPYANSATKYGILDGGLNLFFFAGAVALLAWLVNDAIDGTVGIVTIAIAVNLVGQMQSLAWVFSLSVRSVTESARAATRWVDLKNYGVEAEREASGDPPAALAGGVQLRDVRFRYAGARKYAIDGLSLNLPAASIVAIVGENGAGKTTLAKLLVGLYRTASGTITLDEVDLKSVNKVRYRRELSGAFQDHLNLEYTAQESVGAGDLSLMYDDDSVVEALYRAAAETTISNLPEGLRTQLGPSWPHGVDLSGGQWQRLAVGRAMMRKSPLLMVLDEPTSVLDAASEHALFERYIAAAEQHKGRGGVTVLITHRFSTVTSADLVVFLSDGKVAELGTHEELLHRKGMYAELYNLQAKSYE